MKQIPWKQHLIDFKYTIQDKIISQMVNLGHILIFSSIKSDYIKKHKLDINTL